MVDYMSLEEQVDADFSRARRRALFRRMRTRLRGGSASNRLLCFDALGKVPGASARVHRGTRTVLVSQIGGSVGRCSEFDSDFMPTKASVGERWKRIDRAFHRGEELPPVSLYKVGGFYFVLDGHHRLSVASYQGVEWIDADVTEFGAAAAAAYTASIAGSRPTLAARNSGYHAAFLTGAGCLILGGPHRRHPAPARTPRRRHRAGRRHRRAGRGPHTRRGVLLSATETSS